MTNRGFSLLEMLVVLVIIGVLTAVALPYYYNAVESARMTEVVTLWGRTKNWINGQYLSQEQADRITNRLSQAKLKYFEGKIRCIDKENPQEICWEAEFTQQNEKAHARYKLVTTHNFTRLACVPLNNAGEDFCISQAQSENAPEQVEGEKAYWVR